MINCRILPNGDLLVTAGNSTRAYIAERQAPAITLGLQCGMCHATGTIGRQQ